MTRLYTLLALGLCCFNADLVLADDEGLYGQPIPDDAVFVRFIGDASSAFGFDFSDHIEGEAYVIISQSLLMDAPSSTFTSVVSHGTSVSTFSEPERSSRSKVNLFVLNNGTSPVSLLANDGEVAVLKDVMPGQTIKREVNPVSLDFQIADSTSSTILANINLNLKRGQDITFVVIGDQVEIIPTTFGAVLEAAQ